MAPKAHPIGKVPSSRHKSIYRLFAAAFNQPKGLFERISLCGWRPLASSIDPLHPLLAEHAQDDMGDAGQDDSNVAVKETDVGITIEIDVPEIKEDSLYLEVFGDTLIIRGERLEPIYRMQWHAHDPQHGNLFQRLVQLPVLARPGKIRARLMGTTIRVDIKK